MRRVSRGGPAVDPAAALGAFAALDAEAREGDHEAGASAWTFLDPDLTTVRGDEVADEGEAESHAAGAVPVSAGPSAEPLEDPVAVLGRHAGPAVVDDEPHLP